MLRNKLIVMIFVALTIAMLSGASFPAYANDAAIQSVITSPDDFIEKNLIAFEEELRKMKERYAVCCGSILAAMSPTDVETIGNDLPKPKTLKLTVKYPPINTAEQKAKLNGLGEFFLRDLHASAIVDPAFNLNGAYSMPPDNRSHGLVAADTLTSELFGIPQKIYYTLGANIVWIDPSRKTGASSSTLCGGSAIPNMGFGMDNPLHYKSQLNLNIKSNGLILDEKTHTITFSMPGNAEVIFSSNRKYLPQDPYILYRTDCVEPVPGGFLKHEKVAAGYKPAGTEEAHLRFTAVQFLDFNLPGFGKLEKYGTKPELDYFTDIESAKISPDGGRHYDSLVPYILVDYGNAGGVKARPFYALHAPVSWKTKTRGPFGVNDGNIKYHGGYGATDFYITLGGTKTVEHRLTANIVDVQFDDGLKTGRIAPGKTYAVTFKLNGPADPDEYQVRWKAPELTVEKETTVFEGKEDKASTGSFSLPLQEPDKPDKIKQFKITGSLVKKTNPDKVYYKWESENLTVSSPAIAKLELYREFDKGSPEPVTGRLDMFFPCETSSIPLIPFVILGNGKAYSLSKANPDAIIEIASNNPAAVSVYQAQAGDEDKGKSRLIALCSGQVGTSDITARIGGPELDSKKHVQFTGNITELKSDTVTINANRVFLLERENSNNKKTFKLIVQGPTDMSVYQALWAGEGKRSTSFRKDADGYSTSLTTTLRMSNVRIVKNGVETARIAVKPGSVIKADISLIPPNPPVAVIKKVSVTDTGNLETLTECRESVRFGMEYLGFDPGATIDEYCSAERERKKEEIKAERKEQKAYNKMVDNYKKAGKELIVFGNDIRIGAAVKGDVAAIDGSLFCVWSLKDGGNLSLERSITPVENISAEEGGCFNIVSGMKQGFDPDARIQVDLVAFDNVTSPVVALGSKVTFRAELLKD